MSLLINMWQQGVLKEKIILMLYLVFCGNQALANGGYKSHQAQIFYKITWDLEPNENSAEVEHADAEIWNFSLDNLKILSQRQNPKY